MEMNRVWAMPNKRTFQIKPIKELLRKEFGDMTNVVDPFPFTYSKDALKYMNDFDDNTVERLVFDPPYSPRQLKECYDSIGQSLTQLDTSNHTWKVWKDEIARIVKPNGIVISFGWNTCGIGKTRGFKIIGILLVCHGGNHNDTIVTVEKKINQKLL